MTLHSVFDPHFPGQGLIHLLLEQAIIFVQSESTLHVGGTDGGSEKNTLVV